MAEYLNPTGDANWHAQRLSVERGLDTYLRTIDPAAEVPPSGEWAATATVKPPVPGTPSLR